MAQATTPPAAAHGTPGGHGPGSLRQVNRRHRWSPWAGAVAAMIAAPLLAPPAQAAEPCWGGVFSDLDGGGPDVVVGLPSYDLPGLPDAGAIVVFSDVAERHSTQPRTPAARTLLTADDFPGTHAEAGARFGAAVVVVPDRAEDADACADVWIGSPGQTVAGRAAAGRVHVLAGRDVGLVLDRVIDLDTLTGGGGPQAGARFGSAIAIDPSATVAIGEPGRDLDGAVDAGRVIRLDDPGTGEEASLAVVQQGGDGAGRPETGDRFGEVLSVAPTGVGTLLLVGIPGEDIGGLRDAGAVALHPEGGTLSMVSQDSPGAAGRAEAGDRFGASIGVHASFSVDHPIEVVVIGTPGEDLGRVRDAGAVLFATIDLFTDEPPPMPVIRGSSRSQTQDTPGVPGVAEAGDAYGSAVVTAEFGVLGGRQRLVATAPLEDLGSRADAGLLTMTTIDEPTGAPVPGEQSPAWTQDSPGVSGVAERGDHFGARASAVQLTRDVGEGEEEEPGWPVILVTVPGEDRRLVADGGMAYLGVAPGVDSVPLLPPTQQPGAGRGMVPMRLAVADL